MASWGEILFGLAVSAIDSFTDGKATDNVNKVGNHGYNTRKSHLSKAEGRIRQQERNMSSYSQENQDKVRKNRQILEREKGKMKNNPFK